MSGVEWEDKAEVARLYLNCRVRLYLDFKHVSMAAN